MYNKQERKACRKFYKSYPKFLANIVGDMAYFLGVFDITHNDLGYYNMKFNKYNPISWITLAVNTVIVLIIEIIFSIAMCLMDSFSTTFCQAYNIAKGITNRNIFIGKE